MTLEYELYWSFRSPYSYLLTPRILAFERDYDVRCTIKFIYPLAIRIEGFFQRANPMAWPYLFKDTALIAEMLGMPFAWPVPDPIVMDFQTGVVSNDQPYIRRLTHLGIAAAERGKGLSFAREISSIIFGGVREWNKGNHLAEATARADLNLSELDSAVERNAQRYETQIARNQKDHMAAGHWGVPLTVFRGEAFYGQDRFDALKWRMKQNGLVPREAGTIERSDVKPQRGERSLSKDRL